MDLETENLLAAMLMDEARRLRQQADKEGVGAYLRNPKVRGRPNSRFLTATVLGVQQANRAVEVNEMWRAREKELELDRRLPHRHSREGFRCDSSKESSSSRPEPSSAMHENTVFQPSDDDGLRDDEVEEFLQSKIKRGRGAIGSRMDEPGPYPISAPSNPEEKPVFPQEARRRVLGPEKPSREQLERTSSSSGGSCLKRQHELPRRRRRRSEDDATSADESSSQRKKDRKRRHRHRSR
ncbi:G patch domain protein [Wolffia australiana]